MAKKYIITSVRPITGREYTSRPLTIEEAVEYYRYTLECGHSWEHEKGNKKINLNPKSIKSLISNLNKASNNSSRIGVGDYYSAVEYTERHEEAVA